MSGWLARDFNLHVCQQTCPIHLTWFGLTHRQIESDRQWNKHEIYFVHMKHILKLLHNSSLLFQSLSLTDFSWVWLLMTFVDWTQCGCIGQPSMSDWLVQDCVFFMDVTLCFDMLRRMCRIRSPTHVLVEVGNLTNLHVFHNLSS